MVGAGGPPIGADPTVGLLRAAHALRLSVRRADAGISGPPVIPAAGISGLPGHPGACRDLRGVLEDGSRTRDEAAPAEVCWPRGGIPTGLEPALPP